MAWKGHGFGLHMGTDISKKHKTSAFYRKGKITDKILLALNPSWFKGTV